MLAAIATSSKSLGEEIRASHNLKSSHTLKSGSGSGRRSSVSADNWARFRLLLSQDQLDRLSYCFGELETEDGVGRVLFIRRCWRPRTGSVG